MPGGLCHLQSKLGFDMGNPWVGISHTVPAPTETVPEVGTGTYRTVISAVLYETRGVFLTHSCAHVFLG